MANNLYYNTKITNDILIVKNYDVYSFFKGTETAVTVFYLYYQIITLFYKNLYICLRLSNQTIFPFNKKAATKSL